MLTKDTRMVEKKKTRTKKKRKIQFSNVNLFLGLFTNYLPVMLASKFALPASKIDCIKAEHETNKIKKMAKTQVKDLLEAGVHFRSINSLVEP